MANLNGRYQATEPQEGFTPVPPGDYTVMFTKDEEKDGGNLLAWFDIIDGAHQGRSLVNYFGFFSDNETARRIANERMTQLLRAANLPDDTMDTSLAYGKTMIASVIIQKKDPTKNSITALKPLAGFGQQPSFPTQQPQQHQPQQAPAQAQAMPWNK